MNAGRTVFSQLMDFIPKYEFQLCVDRYHGHRYVKDFSCWEQFLCMAFAQLTYRKGLASAKNKHPSITEDFAELFDALENDHTIGDWIPGVGAHVRKVRLGVKKANIGKSKGYRLIYFVDLENKIIRPLLLHYKPEIALIPNTQIAKAVKAMSEQPEASAEPSSEADPG